MNEKIPNDRDNKQGLSFLEKMVTRDGCTAIVKDKGTEQKFKLAPPSSGETTLYVVREKICISNMNGETQTYKFFLYKEGNKYGLGHSDVNNGLAEFEMKVFSNFQEVLEFFDSLPILIQAPRNNG